MQMTHSLSPIQFQPSQVKELVKSGTTISGKNGHVPFTTLAKDLNFIKAEVSHI